MSKDDIANPSLFREMSQPFASNAETNAAMRAFQDELAELRKKHKIETIYFIVNGSYLTSDGDETEYLTSGMFGNILKAEILTAWALGHEQAKRQDVIAELMSAPIKRGRRRE